MVQKIHLNTLSDAMIMMLLDHYAWGFHKWLAMLENLKVIQQCQQWQRIFKKVQLNMEKSWKFIKRKIWQ